MTIAALHRSAGSAVLVAAAGPEAERFVLDAISALPTGEARVVRVGILGDADSEVSRALEEAGLTCAVRLGAGAQPGTWSLTQMGDCSPRPAPAEGGAPPSAAEGAVASYRAPPSSAVVEAAWRSSSLSRVAAKAGAPGSWAVQDGRGQTLSAIDFARRTGDLATLRRIEREGGRARAITWSLAIGGGALAVSSLAVLAGSAGGAPERDEFALDQADYRTRDAWETAQEEADADFAAARDAWDIRRADRAWTAGFLGASGLLVMGAAPFAGPGVDARRHDPSAWWRVEDADALIASWNTSSRLKLGLASDPGTLPVVLEEAGDEDEVEDTEGGEDPGGLLDDPESAPSAPAAPIETVPEPPSGTSPALLELQPLIAPGFLGIRGRF